MLGDTLKERTARVRAKPPRHQKNKRSSINCNASKNDALNYQFNY
jgi:hypothetical protein